MAPSDDPRSLSGFELVVPRQPSIRAPGSAFSGSMRGSRPQAQPFHDEVSPWSSVNSSSEYILSMQALPSSPSQRPSRPPEDRRVQGPCTREEDLASNSTSPDLGGIAIYLQLLCSISMAVGQHYSMPGASVTVDHQNTLCCTSRISRISFPVW